MRSPINIIVCGKLKTQRGDKEFFRRSVFIKEIMEKFNIAPDHHRKATIMAEPYHITGEPALTFWDVGAQVPIENALEWIRNATIMISFDEDHDTKTAENTAKKNNLYSVDGRSFNFSSMTPDEIRKNFQDWHDQSGITKKRLSIEKAQADEKGLLQKELEKVLDQTLSSHPRSTYAEIRAALFNELRRTNFTRQLFSGKRKIEDFRNLWVKNTYEQVMRELDKKTIKILLIKPTDSSPLTNRDKFVLNTTSEIIENAVNHATSKTQSIDFDAIKKAILAVFPVNMSDDESKRFDEKIKKAALQFLRNKTLENKNKKQLFLPKEISERKKAALDAIAELTQVISQDFSDPEDRNKKIRAAFKKVAEHDFYIRYHTNIFIKSETTTEMLLNTVLNLEPVHYKALYQNARQEIKGAYLKQKEKLARDSQNKTIAILLGRNSEKTTYAKFVRTSAGIHIIEAVSDALYFDIPLNMSKIKEKIFKDLNVTTMSDNDKSNFELMIKKGAARHLQNILSRDKSRILLSNDVVEGKKNAMHAMSDLLDHILLKNHFADRESRDNAIEIALKKIAANHFYIHYNQNRFSRSKTRTASMMDVVFSFETGLNERYKAIKNAIHAENLRNRENIESQMPVQQPSYFASRFRNAMLRLFGKKQDAPVVGIVIEESAPMIKEGATVLGVPVEPEKMKQPQKSSGFFSRIRDAFTKGTGVMGFLFGNKKESTSPSDDGQTVKGVKQEHATSTTGFFSRVSARMQRLFGKKEKVRIATTLEKKTTAVEPNPIAHDANTDAEIRKIITPYNDASQIQLLHELITAKNKYSSHKNKKTAELLDLAIGILTNERLNFSKFLTKLSENDHDSAVNLMMHRVKAAYHEVTKKVEEEKTKDRRASLEQKSPNPACSTPYHETRRGEVRQATAAPSSTNRNRFLAAPLPTITSTQDALSDQIDQSDQNDSESMMVLC